MEKRKKLFSIKEAYRFGWRTVMARKGFFSAAALVTLLACHVPGVIGRDVIDAEILSILFQAVSAVMVVITGIGWVQITLLSCDGRRGRVTDLFSHWRFFRRFLGGSILVALAFFGGWLLFFGASFSRIGSGASGPPPFSIPEVLGLLLVIPGGILGIRLQFFAYRLVDKGTGVVASLMESFAMTRGCARRLFLFWCAAGAVNLAGLWLPAAVTRLFFSWRMGGLFKMGPDEIAGLVGLLAGVVFMMPTTALAMAFVYRRLACARPL